MTGCGCAVVSGRTLALITTANLLRRARVTYRAAPVYPELLALSAAVLGAANGTQVAIRNAASEAGLMTASEYAQAAGIKPRAVRRACQEGRLPAVKRGPIWLIDPGGLVLRETSC